MTEEQRQAVTKLLVEEMQENPKASFNIRQWDDDSVAVTVHRTTADATIGAGPITIIKPDGEARVVRDNPGAHL